MAVEGRCQAHAAVDLVRNFKFHSRREEGENRFTASLPFVRRMRSNVSFKLYWHREGAPFEQQFLSQHNPALGRGIIQIMSTVNRALPP